MVSGGMVYNVFETSIRKANHALPSGIGIRFFYHRETLGAEEGITMAFRSEVTKARMSVTHSKNALEISRLRLRQAEEVLAAVEAEEENR